jgi:hypothetical protein
MELKRNQETCKYIKKIAYLSVMWSHNYAWAEAMLYN